MPKNPLRQVVARTPVFEDLYNDGSAKLTAVLETLACGHQQLIFECGLPLHHKRHRCQECKQIAPAAIGAGLSVSGSGSTPSAPKKTKEAA